jgi:hypothetical protein
VLASPSASPSASASASGRMSSARALRAVGTVRARAACWPRWDGGLSTFVGGRGEREGEDGEMWVSRVRRSEQEGKMGIRRLVLVFGLAVGDATGRCWCEMDWLSQAACGCEWAKFCWWGSLSITLHAQELRNDQAYVIIIQ